MSIADDAWSQINKVKYEFADLKNKIAVSYSINFILSLVNVEQIKPNYKKTNYAYLR